MKEFITDLTTVSNYCGFFETETGVNNCFGCKHKDAGESDLMQKINGEYHYFYSKGFNEISYIACKLTTRKIKCNKRLAKKFIKKARLIEYDNDVLKKMGLRQAGKCYSWCCPVAYEISFDSIKDYENGSEYDYIESEDEMPEGWGDELMAVELELAEKIGLL